MKHNSKHDVPASVKLPKRMATSIRTIAHAEGNSQSSVLRRLLSKALELEARVEAGARQ